MFSSSNLKITQVVPKKFNPPPAPWSNLLVIGGEHPMHANVRFPNIACTKHMPKTSSSSHVDIHLHLIRMNS